MPMERVITYIDGFNLYFGLKTSGWKRYYWLNLQLLSKNLLRAGHAKIDQIALLFTLKKVKFRKTRKRKGCLAQWDKPQTQALNP